MRNITTLLMLRGQVVHTVIAEALAAAKSGTTIDSAAAKQNVTTIIRREYLESYHRLWHIDNRPPNRKASEITNLMEHYYDFANTKERAREAREVAWKSIDNLMASELWGAIVSSDTDTWRAMDEDGFPSFDLDGIKVYARIDFAYADEEPTIIDWKTGAPTPEDRWQLTLYALYAQAKWGWDPLATKLTVAYLQPELSVDAFTPSSEDIDATTELVKHSFNEMLDLEPAYGKADFHDFPMTDNLPTCRWCRFQGICPGAKRDAAQAAPETEAGPPNVD